MTDNEIIKALECCSDTANKSCKEKKCPAIKECMTDVDILEKSALYLINRQKSEIEKKDTEIDILIRKKEALRDEISELTAEIERLSNFVSEERCREIAKEMFPPVVAKAKSEAYREFAEKFKEKVGSIVTSCQGYEIYETKQYQISAVDFDNLVKELTESKNDLEG